MGTWECVPESDNESVTEKDIKKSVVVEYFQRIRTQGGF
jgi:hypothetical protein